MDLRFFVFVDNEFTKLVKIETQKLISFDQHSYQRLWWGLSKIHVLETIEQIPNDKVNLTQTYDGKGNGDDALCANECEKIDEVCDCITTAIASTESDGIFSYELSKLVSKWIQPSFEDDEDSEFSSRATGKLSTPDNIANINDSFLDFSSDNLPNT